MEGRFTYKHYKTWPDEERWELIDGQAWAMSPAPMTRHQELVGRLFMEIQTFLTGKPCKAYLAPFDVLLPEANETDDEVIHTWILEAPGRFGRERLYEKGARAPSAVLEGLVVDSGELFEDLG
jgi:hypothetical protein